MMVMPVDISFFIMMIMPVAGIFFVIITMPVGRLFIFSLAQVFMMTNTIYYQLLIEVVTHETAPEQVILQLSRIRVDPALEFACSTWTSYLGLVVPNHVRLGVFLIPSKSTFAHPDDHGSLRGMHI